MKKLTLTFLFFCFCGSILAQDQLYRTSCQEQLREVESWFDEGAYLMIERWSHHQHRYLHCSDDVTHRLNLLHVLSSCYIAILSDADIHLAGFSLKHPHTIDGTVSSEYLVYEKFGNQHWLEALTWFKSPHYFYSDVVPKDEWQLAHGYVLFQLERFESAIEVWNGVSDSKAQYFFPSRYYSALAYASMNDLDGAVECFEAVKRYPKYKDIVPYYIAQIYFEKEAHDEVLSTAKSHVSSNSVNPELFRLAGLSAYETDNIDLAISYLSRYVEKSASVSEEIYYILGMCHYNRKEWAKAKTYFEAIAHLEDRYGQLGNYYLADIFLQEGDKMSARNGFARAFRLQTNPQITEQSHFYYGKLSAQLRYDREAIIHLRDIGSTSPYFEEARQIISDLLLSTNDYSNALQTLATIPDKGEELLKAEQILMLQLGLQYYSLNRLSEAQDMISRVANRRNDPAVTNRARFWLAEIAYTQQETDEALAHYLDFIDNTDGGMPLLSARAQYSVGYIYMKKGKADDAIEFFQACRLPDLDNGTLIDANLRLGDLYLQNNDYESAKQYYSKVITSFPQASHDYALYQIAIIQGLQNEPVKKIITLEGIIDNYRDSRYLDDAIFEMGLTLHALGNTKDALATLRFLIDEFESSSRLVIPALLRMALISYNLGDLKQAADYYKEVFAYQPDQSQKKEALSGLREIYVDDLTRPDVYLELEEELGGGKVANQERDSLTFASAQRQYNLGNFQRSVEAFETYLKTYPQGRYALPAHYNLANSALALEYYELAQEQFEIVCAENPARYSDACFNGAEIAYNYSQDFEKATKLYLAAQMNAQSQEEKENAIIGTLRSAYKANKDSLTYLFSQKVLAIEKLDQAERVFAHYCLGKGKMRNGKSALAVNDFNYVAKHTANELAAESRYLISKIYYESGELELAEILCDQANKLNVSFPYWVGKGLILYSDILRSQDDWFNARAALEAVLENVRDFPDLMAEAKAKLNDIRRILDEKGKLNNE